MAVVIIIGVDPGGTTGVVVLELDAEGRYDCLHSAEVPGAQFPQYYAELTMGLIAANKIRDTSSQAMGSNGALLVATEQFVVRGRAAKSRTPQGGAFARRVVGWLESLASVSAPAMRLSVRSASQVKKWATNRRLERAGLLAAIPAGGGHARDAGRHALFAARMDLGWPDPLSVNYPKQ